MGIGFAVSRFGLFLRQLHLTATFPLRTTGVSVYSGVSLVLLGVIVNVAAVIHHVRTVRRLQAGTWEPGLSWNAIVLALLLASVGLGMAVFLLFLRS